MKKLLIILLVFAAANVHAQKNKILCYYNDLVAYFDTSIGGNTLVFINENYDTIAVSGLNDRRADSIYQTRDKSFKSHWFLPMPVSTAVLERSKKYIQNPIPKTKEAQDAYDEKMKRLTKWIFKNCSNCDTLK